MRHNTIAIVSFDPLAASSSSFRSSQLAIGLAQHGFKVHHFGTSAIGGRPSVETQGENLTRYGISQPRRWGTTLFSKVLQHVRWFPEPEREWLRNLTPVLTDVIRNKLITAVIVTTPPHIVQLAGLSLPDICNCYVADLRDDWLSNSRKRWHTPFHRIACQNYERRIVTSAKWVVLNTPEVLRRFTKRYPHCAEKMRVITNGYAEHEFMASSPATPNYWHNNPDRFRIFYGGSDYDGFMPAQLAKLSHDLAAILTESGFHIVSAGAWVWPKGLAKHGHTHLGHVSAREACNCMQSADLLLLPMPPGESEPSGTIPLKTYAYLRSGRSIVYLGESGATTELLSGFSGCYCFSRCHWTSLAKWIVEHFEILRCEHPRPAVCQYEMGAICESFAALLHRCV